MSKFTKTNFNKIVSFVNDYFLYPLATIVIVAFLSVQSKGTIFESVLNWVLLAIFVVWGIYIALLFFKKVSKSNIKVFFVTGFVCLIISLFIQNTYTLGSDILFIIGMISIEIHVLYEILYGVNLSKISTLKILIYACLFVAIGYSLIYVTTYNKDVNNDLFNSLIAVFSAIVGGGLTLGGVAWTIKHEKEGKRREEINKAKPIFDFSPILDEVMITSGSKTCFPIEDEKEFFFDINLLLDNSDQSAFKLKRILHDQTWFILTANTTVLTNRSVVLSFKFNEPTDIVLEVEDSLQLKHYYKIEVINIGLLNGKTPKRHTVRTMRELSNQELQRITKGIII